MRAVMNQEANDFFNAGRIATLCGALCFGLCFVLQAEAQTRERAVRKTQKRSAKHVARNAVRNTAKRKSAFDAATRRESARDFYQVELNLASDERGFDGNLKLRFTNRGSRDVSTLYFRLYPNARPSKQIREEEAMSARDEAPSTILSTTANASARELNERDEPSLEVVTVRQASTGEVLEFALEERDTVLRVPLRASVAPEATTEISIEFRARVPEIEVEETSLLAHVVGQVDAALRDGREVKRARELQFAARDVMMLTAPFPVLAVRDGNDWRRARINLNVGRAAGASDASDYLVKVVAAPDIKVYTSARQIESRSNEAKVTTTFKGENLRDFALIAGRNLRVIEAQAANIKLRSVYLANHERAARRALDVATRAAQIFARKYGNLGQGAHLTISEAPLVAGRSGAKFSGLGVIASAFYVDFDAPAFRNLPEIVRDQQASLEESTEWQVAQAVAHQWWGSSVGTDSEREPALEEALTQFAALDYFRTRDGAERAQELSRDQLRGVYAMYRAMGGDDMPANRAANEYRNSFQFAAIVSSKGALMLDALRENIGEAKFDVALRNFYERHRGGRASLEDLREALINATTDDDGEASDKAMNRRRIARHFNRWLNERHGDTDVAPPNAQLASLLGAKSEAVGGNDKQQKNVDAETLNQRNRFSRFGLFFWKQMTRIR